MSVPPLPSLRDRLFVAMQHALPQHFLSRIVLRVTRIRLWPVKNLLIRSFLRGFKVNMSEAAQPNPLQYPSFNAFFTRALRQAHERSDIDPGALVSPVDGTVSQIGRLDGSKLLQAKGHDYTLEALLDGAPEWAQRFTGGAFATLYLAPYNYHRIHMPIAGTLRAAWFVPGKLFSVNAVTAAAVPGLFAKNERVVCVFEDGPRAFAMVLVGALFEAASLRSGTATSRRAAHTSELTYRSTQPLAPQTQQGRGDGTIQHGLDGHPVDAP